MDSYRRETTRPPQFWEHMWRTELQPLDHHAKTVLSMQEYLRAFILKESIARVTESYRRETTMPPRFENTCDGRLQTLDHYATTAMSSMQ
jgi:hypothetical protein